MQEEEKKKMEKNELTNKHPRRLSVSDPGQMDILGFGLKFCSHLDASPTPFHSVLTIASKLMKTGFTQIKEKDSWSSLVKNNGKYFYTRNGSTLVAFVVGGGFKAGNGFKIIGAHTDSPVLKVKPISTRSNLGYIQVGVETYGGGLWHTWLDRDLGLAGRVVVRNKSSEDDVSSSSSTTFHQHLIHIKRPILRVPALCIHLQTADERAALKINAEDHLTPILGQLAAELNSSPSTTKSEMENKHPPILLKLLAQEISCDVQDIVDFELTLTDVQPSTLGGINSEFIFGPRMDNQMHCFTSSESLIAYSSDEDRVANDTDVNLIALFDHEEVGSESLGGAGSPIMRDAVERISSCFAATPGTEAYKIGLEKSMLISADGAHAIHPNYSGKHEQNHRPKMNSGTVIKTNANQRYATNGVTGFIIREVARRVNVPMQEFVVRQDSPCGSTIGPIISANTGIRTVDVGIPQLSMHSIRETCGVADLESNYRLFNGFFEHFKEIDESIHDATMSSIKQEL